MPRESENSNNILDKFFEYSIDLLCIADTKGNFVKLNPEWEKTLGYSPKELEGKPYLDYVHPDDIDSTLKAARKLSENKPIENFTNRYRHKDGSYRWLEWRSFPYYDKIYASVRDVTRLKKAEEDLKLFKISIDNANDAIYWLNKDASFEYVNDKACKTLGYSRKEFLKLTIFNIDVEITKEKWDSSWEHYQTYKSKRSFSIQMESTYRRKDGSEYPVEISITHFWSDNREFHIAHIRDITERKQHQQALLRSEEKYRSLFENMPYPFSIYRMIYDEKGEPLDFIFEEVNPASEHFTGIPPEKMLGKKVKDLFPNTEDHWIQTFGSVAKTGIPMNFTDFSVELNKYFETFVFSPGKDLCAILFNDVTERKKNEATLINSEKILQESQRIANIGSWEYIIDKDELNWNNQTYEIYGVDKSVKPNYELNDSLIHPGDRKYVANKFQNTLDTGIFPEYEFRIIRPDKTLRYVKIVGDVEYGENKQPYRTYGIIQDITKRKEDDAILNMFKASIDYSLDGVYWLNGEGGFDYINEQACSMLGYKLEELLQLTISDIDPSISLEEHKKNWNRLNTKKSLERHSIESQHKKKDGSFIPVEVNLIFIWINDKGLLLAYAKDISERKNYEKALIENQRLLSESQRVANIGSWENNITTNTLIWNEEAYRIFGYGYQEIELTYENFKKLIHPEDYSYVLSVLLKIIQTKKFCTHEYRIIRKDGENRTIVVIGDVSLNDKGEVYRTYGIMQDITERKKQEKEIFKSQKLLNDSQRISKMGSWEIDLGDESVYWSEAAYQLYGIDKDKVKLTQDKFLEFVHPEDRDYVSQQIKKAIKLGRVDNDEFRIVRPNGQIRYISTTAETLKDSNNNPIKMIGLMQDITEKKEAEQALKDSEQKMESLFRVAPAGMGIIKDRLVIEVNPEGCKISGYSKEELIGKSTRMLYITEEEFLRVGEVLYANLSDGDSSSVETVWRRKDGKIINIYIALIPIDLKDLSKGIVFTVLDITERKQYEEALEKRVLALTRPLGDIDSINITDLFNLEELQELQDSFANATGVASIITYPDGKPITKPSNSCRLCNLIRSTEKGKRNCIASDSLIGKQSLKGPKIQPCKSAGLWDTGASITLGGVHIANWLIGQVRNDELDEDEILNYADEIGINRDVFKKELGEVRVMSKEQFQAVADALYLLANEISLKSYQNLQQARFIAEQKEYEKKIIDEKIKAEESEQRFKALHNASFGGIAIHDKGVILDCNQGLSEISGYSIDELIGMDGLLLVAEKSRELVMANIKAGYEKPYEVYGRRKNGEEYPLRLEARNIPYMGREVRSVEFRDITEQKQAELELVKAKERAEESEFFLQESQRTGNIGSYKMSFKTGYWFSTETLDRIFGIDSSYNRNVEGWLDVVHPKDRKMMANYFQNEVIAKQQHFNKEYRIARKNDGETRWMHGVGKLYFDSSGNLSEMLGTIQDITDRKLIEEDRNKINIELERRVHERTIQLQQANKELEAFAYSISHDLRAPLRHINGFMSLLKNSISPMDPNAQNYFEKISISSKGMSVMIDELLKFSRLGRAKLNLSPVELKNIIEKIVEQFEPDYKERNIDWRIHELPVVNGDAALLKIAFENLISNAIKYTSKKEHAIIEIGSCEKIGNNICVYIKDNGIGFDIAYKDKLFGVFQRLHKQDDFEGVGIGLANVKQIIKKHNGHIDVGAELDKGTTFYITLPIVNSSGN